MPKLDRVWCSLYANVTCKFNVLESMHWKVIATESEGMPGNIELALAMMTVID